jgi:glycosyltransferase involved in cell wall biosynthesis
MKIVHLTDSPFYGGPERQMLGLAVTLPPNLPTTILCFRESGALPFVRQLEAAGVPARMLKHGDPRILSVIADIRTELRAERAELLICHGYKANGLGWLAARGLGIRVLSVSRGWTRHMLRVRVFEALDRRILRLMDGVICVSEGQAARVRRAGVNPERVRVIRNAIDTSRFDNIDRGGRAELERLFASPPKTIVIGVGRLSPEKGFDQLVRAAELVAQTRHSVGFALIGDGPDRAMLETLARSLGLQNSIAFAGFRTDIDRLIAGADILAQSSYSEGLPNVLLEAGAASVPVVATDVGGTREVVRDGETGYLVPSGDPAALAARLIELIESSTQRADMGARARARVSREFSFAHQAAEYEALFQEIRRQGEGSEHEEIRGQSSLGEDQLPLTGF